MKLSKRQKKLELIVNEIDELFGLGNGFVNENTDVDKFIEDFIYKFTEDISLPELFDYISESTNKAYKESFNEI